MKLISYLKENSSKHLFGIVKGKNIFPLNDCCNAKTIIELISNENWQEEATNYINREDAQTLNLSEVHVLSPIPKPTSFRDAYAFRQHVSTSRKNRGVEMIPEFDEFPVFYFSNHNAIFANNEDLELMPDHFHRLDYELEFAIVIGKGGKNISSKEADKHIAGFCILNDLSARRLQMEEMKLNLGPAKGKDFANVLGPYLVTPDELENKSIHTPFGKKYDLNMKCFVNGELLSEGNAKDMNWTFAEIIERASYGVELFPGDVIGSGTVGTGCLLELNGTGKRENPNYIERWLNEGDEIKMQIEGLGEITNRITKSNSHHSILKLKK
jgi:fumarylacetoacetate (FAA) hydrolase